MTRAQAARLYWPAWRRTLTAAWLTTDDGFAPCRPGNPFARRTIEVAARLPSDGGVSAERLRYACNAIAQARRAEYLARLPEGAVPLNLDRRAVSSRRLDSLGLDLVLTWWRLCADDTDLEAALYWSDPALLVRRRIERHLRVAIEGYVAHLARQKFGTSDWTQLGDDELRQLYITLRNRPHAWARAR